MIPAVIVTKNPVGGSPAIQTTQGVLALIASCSTGTTLQPTSLASQSLATSTFGSGMLPECATYVISNSGNPVVAVASTASVAGTYGTITKNIAGTATVSAGSTQPLLHYDVIITVVNGGMVGTTGITYTWTVDGGDSTSGITALGTATTLTIPSTGVSFTLNSSGTLEAGDNWSVFTERPLLNNSDLSAALAALGNTKLPWEGFFADVQYGTGTVSLVDTWLASREVNGQFNFGILNTRYLLEPTPTGEAPATYSAAITAQTANDASNRLCVCADGGHMTSLVTGYTTKFPTAVALGAMAMSLTPNIGTDPAAVANGPVAGFEISSNGNPNDWDEFLYQSLDSQRLTTLRSFPGNAGTFITNANVLISAGSNIIYLQLLRVINKAAAIAWQALMIQLSRGVRTIVNPATQAVNIDPRDKQTIEGIVNQPLRAGLSGQVSQVQFSIDASSDLSEPGAPLNCTVGVVAFFYLKNIRVSVSYVKSISAPTGGGA